MPKSRPHKVKPPARLADIAKHLDVSIATVSRALTGGSGKISAHQTARIRAAAKELGYVPNGAARSLVSRQARAMGIVVPTLGVGLFSAGVETLQRRLQEASYALLLANSQYDSVIELGAVRAFVERGIDGIVLVGNAREPEVYDLLQRNSIPYVNAYIYSPTNVHPCIGIDNRAATFALTRTLLSLGHREFAIVAHAVNRNDRAAERVDGIRACLNENGIEPSRILDVSNTILDGRSALRTLLRSKDRFSAVMCTNDMLAIGILAEARSQGIAVPGDLSVTGFDDYPISAHLHPPLTTVEVTAEELGLRLADYLLARAQGRPCADAVQLPAKLILRESIGPPDGRRAGGHA